MVVLLVKYKCKPGCRDAYFEAIRNNHIGEKSQSEEGCIRYEYSLGIADDELILTEVWRDEQAVESHRNSEHFAKLRDLKAEYVEETEIMKFNAEKV